MSAFILSSQQLHQPMQKYHHHFAGASGFVLHVSAAVAGDDAVLFTPLPNIGARKFGCFCYDFWYTETIGNYLMEVIMGKGNNESNRNDKLELREEFELREKRLALVYKLLYVFAAIWASILLAYASNPHETAPLFCGLLATLATAITNIIFFIFSELRCLGITAIVDNEIKYIADEKYLSIWDTFGLSLFVSMLLTWVNMMFPQIFTQVLIAVVLTVGVIAEGISIFFTKKVGLIIRNIATPMVLYALFSVLQFSSSV